MTKLTHWIRHHQVLAFFLLVYMISWPLLICYFLVIAPINPDLGVLLEPLIVFSPALMAMLVAGIAEPRPKAEKSRPRWIAFLLSWLVSYAILVLYGLKVYGISLIVALVIFSVIALFPAWVLSSAYARTPGVRKLFSTLLKPRGPAWWYLGIFLIFPGIPLLGMWITRLFGGEAQFFMAGMAFKDVAILLLLEFLHVFLMTGGINEESGWRGFALPRLQARYPVLVAGLIVGILWALWHLPFDLGSETSIAWILTNRLFFNLVFSILMTWLYNRTNGSILAPALFHAAMNAFGNQFSVNVASGVLFAGLAIFAIVYDRMWKKLPPDHPAVYQEPGLPDQNQMDFKAK